MQQKSELDGINIVIYIYNGKVRTQRDNLSRLKSLLERDILSGKCTLVPIQCTFSANRLVLPFIMFNFATNS